MTDSWLGCNCYAFHVGSDIDQTASSSLDLPVTLATVGCELADIGHAQGHDSPNGPPTDHADADAHGKSNGEVRSSCGGGLFVPGNFGDHGKHAHELNDNLFEPEGETDV